MWGLLGGCLPTPRQKCQMFVYSGHALIATLTSSQASHSNCGKQIFQMNITGLQIPTGGRQTSWLFTNMTEELNWGPPRNNSSLVVRAGLEPVTSGFQVRCPNHSATVPRPSLSFVLFHQCDRCLSFLLLHGRSWLGCQDLPAMGAVSM